MLTYIWIRITAALVWITHGVVLGISGFLGRLQLRFRPRYRCRAMTAYQRGLLLRLKTEDRLCELRAELRSMFGIEADNGTAVSPRHWSSDVPQTDHDTAAASGDFVARQARMDDLRQRGFKLPGYP